MKDYDNYLVWVVKISEVIIKIEKLLNIKINYINYKNIFKNLDKYIEIDDIIFNTEVHPFLYDLCCAIKTYPNKNFKIIFADYLTIDECKKHNLYDNKKISSELSLFIELRDQIWIYLKKFFKKSEKKLFLFLKKTIII